MSNDRLLKLKKYPEKSWKVFRWSTYAFWALTLGVFVFFLVGYFAFPHEVTYVGDTYDLSDGWQWVHENGSVEDIVLPVKLDVDRSEPVTIQTILPDNITDEMVLYYYAGRDFELYIDGVLRKSFDNTQMELPGRVVKGVFWAIPITENDRGKTLTIYKDEIGVYNGNINVIRYGDISALNQRLFRENGMPALMAVLLFVVSIFIVIGCWAYQIRSDEMLSIKTLAYGMLVVSAWILCDSYMFQVILRNYFVDGIVSYMLILIMPFPFVRFINVIQNRRYEKVYVVTNISMLVTAVLFTILHFTDVLYYEEARVAMNMVLLVIFVVLIVVFIYDAVKGNISDYIYVVVGFAGLIISSIIEIILISLPGISSNGSAVIIGLYFLLVMTFVHSVSELSKIEHARQEALHASMLKSNFLANMSHEIRTPINSIIGMNEMIMRENQDPNIAEYADYISRSSKLLIGIISDILDFSKIESGAIKVVKEEYDTAEMLRTICDLLEERATQKNIRPIVTVDANIPSRFKGDVVHIEQILINILSNAVKYTEQGTVALSAHVKMEHNDSCKLCFRVSDTGIGIKEADLEHLFDSFSRFDEKRNKSIQGTGLGMAITKELVEILGGTIDVESEYGRGSNFIIEIPQEPASIDVIGDKWRNAKEKKEEKKGVDFTAPEAKALAVDDNRTNLLIIRQYLKKTGIHVDMCSNGEEAIKKCQTEAYDIILLDHMMPVMDGVETVKYLRAHEGANQNIPIIALTANALSGSREEYLSSGFTDYMPKPIDINLFEKMVSHYLPQEKVIYAEQTAVKEKSGETIEENSVENKEVEKVEKVTMVEKIDRQKLVDLFGDEAFADEIIHKVAEEALATLDKLTKELEEEDFKNYAIDAHGIKGMMASIYYEPLRAWAKEHEFAAKEGRYDYIREDLGKFQEACREFCNEILNG